MYSKSNYDQYFSILQALDITLYAPKDILTAERIAESKSQVVKQTIKESINMDQASKLLPEDDNKHQQQQAEKPNTLSVYANQLKNNKDNLSSKAKSLNEYVDDKAKQPEAEPEAVAGIKTTINKPEAGHNKHTASTQQVNKASMDSLGTALINKFDEVECDYDLTELKEKVSGCEACSLSMSRKQVIFGEGSSDARILVITSMPTKQEDDSALPLMGESLTLFESMLKSIHLSMNDVFVTNVVKCHSKFPISTIGDEVLQCREHLDKQINTIEPELILVLGDFATQVMLKTENTVKEMRATRYQYTMESSTLRSPSDEGHDIYPMIVSFHPLQLLQNAADKKFAWQDLKYIAKFLQLDK